MWLNLWGSPLSSNIFFQIKLYFYIFVENDSKDEEEFDEDDKNEEEIGDDEEEKLKEEENNHQQQNEGNFESLGIKRGNEEEFEEAVFETSI